MAKIKVIKTTFKLRRGTADAFKTNNPLLADGEPAYELDAYKLKIGDGKTNYNDLPYIGGEAIITEEQLREALEAYIAENGLPTTSEFTPENANQAADAAGVGDQAILTADQVTLNAGGAN